MRWRLFLLLLAVLTLAACGRPPAPPRAAGPRLVSLTPSLTELLFDLGLGRQVVGVTKNDSYPPEVEQLPKVGDMQIDYEALLALKPTLVVFDAGFNAEQAQRLQNLGVKTLELKSASLDGLEKTVHALGEATGSSARAQRLMDDWKARLQEIRNRGRDLKSHPTVFVEVWGQPLMTAGNNTYVDELITLAGGRNAFGDRSGYLTITPESLLERNPDLIVLTVSSEAEARQRPGWASLTGKVRRIDSDLLVRPTLRNVQALEQLQRWFSE